MPVTTGGKAIKIAFTILLWVYAICGLLALLTISLGKPPVGMDWFMISVSVVFFGNKIRRRCKRSKARVEKIGKVE